MLKGKKVLLGVTGSIAAYKAANLAGLLKKQGADVYVVMTENATEFITPLTFSSLTGNRCVVNTFDNNFEYEIGHISLAKKIDLAVIAPATANVIAKLAHGLADDMLTTTLLATKAPLVIAPAMNTGMYENVATQENISLLKSRGVHFVEPASGLLACGDVGKGKMEEPEVILEHVVLHMPKERPLSGKKILISAGPTVEAIDPVRFISNHSTGKMGYAMAKAAAYLGAEVTLVSGRTAQKAFSSVEKVDVLSAEDMYNAVTERAEDADIIIMTAAVADFTPENTAADKIKKKDISDMSIRLKPTKDILKTLGATKKSGQFICGFSMETKDMLENSRTKLESKNVDMIVANNLKTEGAGFGTDTNIVTVITKEGHTTLPIGSKFDVSKSILLEISKKL